MADNDVPPLPQRRHLDAEHSRLVRAVVTILSERQHRSGITPADRLQHFSAAPPLTEGVPVPHLDATPPDEPTHHADPHSRYRAPANIAAIGSLVAGGIGLVGLLPGLLGIIAICCAVVGHKQAADMGRGTKLAIAGLLLSLLCLARGLTGT